MSIKKGQRKQSLLPFHVRRKGFKSFITAGREEVKNSKRVCSGPWGTGIKGNGGLWIKSINERILSGVK